MKKSLEPNAAVGTISDSNFILQGIPTEAIPSPSTKARRLLLLLSDGLPHNKIECMLALGNDTRGPLQSLTGANYGFWLIHNLTKGSGSAVYQLDYRHLTGIPADDSSARIDAEVRYRERSNKIAQRESERLARASIEFHYAIQKRLEAERIDK